MSWRLMIDVNLSPEGVPFLAEAGIHAYHWRQVGNPSAPDQEIIDWATDHGYAVFTHDLDFSVMLALTSAGRPSVIQLRGPQVLPEQIGPVLLQSLRRFRTDLERGALVVVEPGRSRVRVLPL
jgi:predicted nuclease of predicted toxin-antitoxin system